MGYVYSDPTREEHPTALPDVEVFFSPEGGEYGDWRDDDGEPLPAGWYWWACFPGCLPDGDPIGPFDSEAAAIEDAQESAYDPE